MATVDDLVVKVRADISNLQRGVDSANRSLGSINTKGSRAFGNIAKSVAATTAKITALASAIGGLGVAQIAQVGMRFEDLDDSLNRVFGSLQGGREAFSQIQTFAQTTPFSIETVTKAFIGLKSAGIEPNMKMLQTFADTASVSTDQLGTFETLIRITQRSAGGGLGLEELNQISDRGIDIFSGLSKTLNKSRDELSKLGQTAEGARIIMNALRENLEGDFGGAMAEKMDNLSTKVSNMGIAFRNVANEIFKSGLGKMLKNLADEFTSIFNQISGILAVRRGGGSFAQLDIQLMEKQAQLRRLEGSTGRQTAGNRARLKQEIANLQQRMKDQRDTFLRNDPSLTEEMKRKMGLLKPTDGKVKKEMGTEQVEARDLALSLAEAGKTDQEKLNEQFAQLALLDGTMVDPVVLEKAQSHLQNLQKELSETANVMSTELKQAIESNVNSFSNNFVRSLLDGQNALSGFKDFAKDMVAQIISTFIRLKVIEPFMNALFSGFSGFSFGGFGGGGGGSSNVPMSFAAGGGRVGMGMPTLVGERGPELFVPDTSGVIRSHADTQSMMGGSGIVINQSINFSTGIVPTVRAEVSRMLPQIADVTKGAVLESAQRGGQFRKGLQGING